LKLSIVVTSYGAADCLEKCLDSLQHLAPPFAHEVMVVDNHSPDGSAEIVRARFPQFRLIALEENLGFARATNLAARECRGEFLLFLNGDAQATPGAIERLAGHLEARPEVGIVGPRLEGSDGRMQVSWGRVPFLRNEALRWLLHLRLAGALRLRETLARTLLPARKCAWVSGAALMGRREALFAPGESAVFDERFFLYFEDIDLCLRAAQRGFKVHYLPDVTFIHAGGASAAKSASTARRAYRDSQVEFYRKHFGGWRAHIVEGYVRCRRMCI
jgi:N-acetylglucosaminyl-diphospho-decaprenol L-rhamnosyltransferase